MKFSSSTGLVALMAGTASAFPAAMVELMAERPELQAQADSIMRRQESADAATGIFEPLPLFDERSQYVDVSEGSGHEWRAPGPRDIRGPCPGLNAFANHGFLPRSGFASISQYIDATVNVVGMGPDLAGFLAAYGAAIDGNGLGWSMGGTPGRAISGSLLGNGGNGLTGSHNKYESDASPTRGDLYVTGDNYKADPALFQQLIDFSPGGEVSLNSLTALRSKRFDDSVATNPFFVNAPFSGLLVQPAGYTFAYRFMANHSEERPIGELSYDVIESWFGMSGGNGNYVADHGQERIPDNWYKRAVAYPYTIPYFLADAANAIRVHPKFANVGGNTGTTNSFVGVDVDDMASGLGNGLDLLEGNKFACLAYQFAAQAKPDLALDVLDIVGGPIRDITTTLACPELKGLDDAQLRSFPGYVRSS